MDCKVLLIEPDRVLAKTYQHALEAGGCQVARCATAQAAILLADKVNPDVVIVELQLVEHSGVEFLYEFRSYPDWQNIPVILHTNVQSRQLGKDFASVRTQLGIAEYLYKPHTTLHDLVGAVRHASQVAA